MIDIHSHFVFDVDDGARNIEESLAILKESYAQGVRKMIATPHRRLGKFESPEEKIHQHFLQIKKETEKIFPDFLLYEGAEIYYSEEMIEYIKKASVASLAGSSYYLIEFPTQSSLDFIKNAVDKLLSENCSLVLAHIERYASLAFEKEILKDFLEKGVFFQVNASSLLDEESALDKKKEHYARAIFLLENALVHFVASDTHNMHQRKTCMAKAFQKVQTLFGKERAEELFEKNQQKIFFGEAFFAGEKK